MASVVQQLTEQQVIKPPKFLPNSVCMEVVMGSVAYGVSNDMSDVDLYGFCVPPRDNVFPHLKGEIPGFGSQTNRFEQFQQHHIKDPKHKGVEYDVTIYSIIKYFQLLTDNNPNMVDSLFVPLNCIKYSTDIGNMVRENRKIFLHKGSWHKFKGYAFNQLHKMENAGKKKEIIDLIAFEDEHEIPRSTTFEEVCDEIEERGFCHKLSHLHTPELNKYYEMFSNGMNITKRFSSTKVHSIDVKFGYHIVRLLNEVEMILTEHDLDITRSSAQLKSIRRGEWTAERIREYFEIKEKTLEEVYHTSKLQYAPNEVKIKDLLLQCLEHHYGSLDGCLSITKDMGTKAYLKLKEIQDIVTDFDFSQK